MKKTMGLPEMLLNDNRRGAPSTRHFYRSVHPLRAMRPKM
jgi:hypothetical protein